jgi:hypothetical protein
MLPDEGNHGACVVAWLTLAPEELGPGALLDLFDRGLDAVWQRANATLGDVTLTAIADRVVYTVAETHPLVAALKVGPAGFRFDDLRAERHLRAADVREIARLVLTELLTVLGTLTAEILTPSLHAELGAVGRESSTPDDAGSHA